MDTHHQGLDGYDLFLRIFTFIAGLVVGGTALYMLFGLFSQFTGIDV